MMVGIGVPLVLGPQMALGDLERGGDLSAASPLGRVLYEHIHSLVAQDTRMPLDPSDIHERPLCTKA